MRRFAIVAASCFALSAAHANDSTAEFATGGLVFTKNDAIAMRAEDLRISLDEVRVAYRFLNTADRDITTLVAFPMPDITVETDSNIALPTEDPENLLDFRTVADGKPVTARVEQKALGKGIDQTAMLRSLGIPLAPHLQGTGEALDKLPRAKWDELVGLGLAEITQYDVGQGMTDHLEARWTLKTTYFWEQTFPSKRELAIEHRYQPSVGASVQTSIGSPDSAKEDWYGDYQRKYCMDAAFLAAVERARRAAKSEYGGPFSEHRIAYILSTGANWAGPIGDFRLTVDKGDAKSLVSFCGQDVTKTGATQFEMRKRDFTPQGDFYVLILKPLEAQ